MGRPIGQAAKDTQNDLAAWMVQFGPALRRYFHKRVAPGEVDDLVQEVFLRLQGRAQGGAVANVQGYLFTVAKSVLISRHRYDAARGGGSIQDEHAVAVEEVDPERELIGKQELERMVAALRRLPPRAQEAFIFHRFEEMSHAAIAARMGISVIGVRKLLARAMERLGELMEGRTA